MNTIDCSPIVFFMRTYCYLMAENMNIRTGLAETIRTVRQAKGLTQEDFSDVSSRTYLSMIERGLRSPTLEKLIQLAGVLGIHPLTLLTLAFSKAEDCTHDCLIEKIAAEVAALNATAQPQD